MSFWATLFGADTIKETVGVIGDAAGGILDRVGFTKQMSASEKAQHIKDILAIEVAGEKNELDDINKARELAIIQMQTQPASWVVRQLNGALRPVAGWMALIYISDKFWGPILASLIEAYKYIPVDRDPVVDGIMGGILAFFFGFRQRSKEKRVS